MRCSAADRPRTGCATERAAGASVETFADRPCAGRAAKRTGGVTLVETLLAATLGALLLIALLNLYQRGVAMHTFAESRSALTETLFTTERIVADELHLAGGLPCGPGGARFNLVHTSNTTPWLRLFTEPVQITPGAVAGSDELTVLKTGEPVPLVDHDPAQARLTLTHAASFERGGLVVVCDDAVTVLLQITDDAGRVLNYDDDARVHPGNCAAPFTGGCGPAGHRFAGNALIAPYEPVVFFIANSGERRSLHRKRLIAGNSASGKTARLRSEEMIENIVLLHADAGVADAGGRVRLTRNPAGAGRVIVLDVGLIATARERNADVLPHAPLHLLGEPVDALLPADATADNRLVTAHEFSVAF